MIFMNQDRNIKNSLKNYDELEDSDFSRAIMPEHRALVYTEKEESIMAKKAMKSNVNVEETKKVSTKAKKPVEKQAEEQEEPETKVGLKDRLKKGAKTLALIVGIVGAVALGNKMGQSKGYANGIRDAKDLQGSVPALPEPEPGEEDIIEDDESSDDV